MQNGLTLPRKRERKPQRVLRVASAYYSTCINSLNNKPENWIWILAAKLNCSPSVFHPRQWIGQNLHNKIVPRFEGLNSIHLKTWCAFTAPGLYFRGDLCVQASPGCIWTLPEMIQEFCSTNGCCDPGPIWLVLECVKVSASVNTTRTNTSLPSDDVSPHSDWQPFPPPQSGISSQRGLLKWGWSQF